MDDREAHAEILDDIDPELAGRLRRGTLGWYELPVAIRAIVADRLDAARRPATSIE